MYQVKNVGAYSETVLWDNALVKLIGKTKNQLYCYACSSFASWQNHIVKATHIEALARFNATFERKGLIVLCKFCDKYLDRPDIETHGTLHDNYFDNYQQFFENNIVEWKEKFYCSLCNTILLDSVAAIQHIDESTHKNVKEKSATPGEFSDLIPPNETYKSLVSEGFTPVDDIRLNCKFCKLDIAFNKTKEHVEAFCHWYFKINFSPRMNDEKTMDTDTTVISQNVEATETANESSFNIDFEKFDEKFVHCKVCESVVYRTEENIKLHLAQDFHVNALLKHGCEYISLREGDIYYCECCKLSLSNRITLCLHINEERHAASKLASNRLKLQSSLTETPKSVVVPANIPCNYIVRKNTTSFYCEVCNLELLEAAVAKHSLESSHAASLLKYGCDGISMRGLNHYNCKYCGCWIPGRNNVFLHIKGKRHTCCLLISRRQQLDEKIKKNAEEAKPERPEWSKALSSMVDELSELSKQLKCKTKAKNPRSSRHLARESIEVDNEQTPCNFCSSIVTNGADLHCHMAGHLTMDFVCSPVDENCDHRKNSPSGKAKVKQEKITVSDDPESLLDSVFGTVSPIKVPPNNNLQTITNCNSNLVFFGNYAPVKTVAIKDTKDCNKMDVNDSLLEHFGNISSIISDKEGLPKIESIKMNDESTIVASSTVISGNYAPVKNIAVEDHKVPCETEKKSQSFDQKNSGSNSNDNSTARKISRSSSITPCASNYSDDEYSSDSETLQKEGKRKKITMRKIIKMLDFDKDYIYEMKAKKRDIEMGIKLSMIFDGQSAYCLICRRTVSSTPQNFHEHLNSLDHSECFEAVEKDHFLFEGVTGQFSELDLAYQYMEEISKGIVQCLVCNVEIANDDFFIRQHAEDENHQFARDEHEIFAKQQFTHFETNMQCDWYNIHKYWCVPCSADFESEVNFVKHLESKKHLIVTNNRENRERTLMFNFCGPCALLWYGYRSTYAYHCDVPSHKWLLRDGHYSLPGLPELAKDLLAVPEKFVGSIDDYLKSIEDKERIKEEIVIEELQNAVKPEFFNAKAHVCGSKISGLHVTRGDIDIFLDCGNRYNGNDTSDESLSNLIKQVQECLINSSSTWDLIELLTHCQPSVIRAHHGETRITCNILLENGLSVENTMLIKSFSDNFPPFRKLILSLKQWLQFCNLSGSERISSYALYWCVIFYLQRESILPSIATLISMNNKSRIIAGWEIGVTHEFTYNKFENAYRLKDLLMRFFKFYANFDFRYDVVCPLLGEEIKKRAFTNPHTLPKEMAPYVAYINKSADSEPFRIDSVMCIQDPFALQHNITKAVSKTILYRFRSSCSKSLDLLCP